MSVTAAGLRVMMMNELSAFRCVQDAHHDGIVEAVVHVAASRETRLVMFAKDCVTFMTCKSELHDDKRLLK
ncbi:hypothetical protein [Bradyrhizobium canariense]|uniref:hypothetical protein n=1 Tax=Bradyrhizobium TaxID=374 RepID=UPI000A18BC81|nr:hypothetical protein [Bradyrhizobium canariense]OSI32968.1 hypothetical protein BST65_03605 [Bradyrhizobium canariense]OSI36942.1 hypothetical protein BST66_04965 [Bradyrhizobium canariense]OSI50351.1 hypothetical protein BSZ20_05855 [Bradyrhizobium canariense]OSI55771.1 hypothetical protein BST67_04460 [Bradyrhizobium canariense]OSI59065.1 hypothetical protein BSZ15_06705 [Bradyrhizobium canariense]